MIKQPICKLLPWDTEFFGFPVARLQRQQLNQAILTDAFDWCRDNNIRCLYYLAPAEDAVSLSAAQLAGFRFVDVRLTLAQDPPLAPPDEWGSERLQELVIRQAVAADRDDLVTLAPPLARVSRFGVDAHFGWKKAVALYERWLQKETAVTLIAKVANEVAGCISCDIVSDGVGVISLLATHPNYHGKGVGTALCHAGLNWMTEQGCRSARVVTQGHNVASQRIYQRGGFLTQSVELWFHKWFDFS